MRLPVNPGSPDFPPNLPYPPHPFTTSRRRNLRPFPGDARVFSDIAIKRLTDETKRCCTFIQFVRGNPTMPESRTAAAVFDQEFLPIRAKLLEVAASLDRFGRAKGTTKT